MCCFCFAGPSWKAGPGDSRGGLGQSPRVVVPLGGGKPLPRAAPWLLIAGGGRMLTLGIWGDPLRPHLFGFIQREGKWQLLQCWASGAVLAHEERDAPVCVSPARSRWQGCLGVTQTLVWVTPPPGAVLGLPSACSLNPSALSSPISRALLRPFGKLLQGSGKVSACSDTPKRPSVCPQVPAQRAGPVFSSEVQGP